MNKHMIYQIGYLLCRCFDLTCSFYGGVHSRRTRVFSQPEVEVIFQGVSMFDIQHGAAKVIYRSRITYFPNYTWQLWSPIHFRGRVLSFAYSKIRPFAKEIRFLSIHEVSNPKIYRLSYESVHYAPLPTIVSETRVFFPQFRATNRNYTLAQITVSFGSRELQISCF